MSPAAPILEVVSARTDEPDARAFAKLGHFFGLDGNDVEAVAPDRTPPVGAPTAIAAIGFAALEGEAGRAEFERLLQRSGSIFIWGVAAAGGDSAALRWLTDGAFQGVAILPAGDHRYDVQDNLPGGRHPVSGGAYSVPEAPAAVLVPGVAGERAQTHILVDGQPHFVSLQRGGVAIYLLAGGGLLDLDESWAAGTSGEPALREHYAEIIAIGTVLRSRFGPRCWRSRARGANIIVDDPYLAPRYGFIRYDRFIPELRRRGVALTIAFIPYNFRRSRRRTVELFRANADRIGLTLHGCDHTGGEYTGGDAAWLEGTTAVALERMERHRQATGLHHENFMVFPQGRFSRAGIEALRRGFVAAAVNTTPWPEDWREQPPQARDLLDVATTCYARFPIFLRRYPVDAFDHAFDAFCQKPVLVVEHHDHFRHGFDRMGAYAERLQAAIPDLEWMTLGRALAESYLVRRNRLGELVIRHYLPELRYRNPDLAPVTVRLEKPEQENSVAAVIVNGREIGFEVRGGVLRYTAMLEPGAELSAMVRYRPEVPRRRSVKWRFRARVAVRRWLSDLRDNHLCRSPRLMNVISRFRPERAAPISTRPGALRSRRGGLDGP